MIRRAPWLAWVLMLALAIGCSVACGQSGAPAWVAEAEAAHREAARELDHGDVSSARNVLQRAVTTPVPHSIRAEDARVVRQDLYYRLAMLELDTGRADAAIEWANSGLGLGAKPDVFTTNLYIVRAEAEKTRGQMVAAARDYHEALKISESLLDTALDGDAQ